MAEESVGIIEGWVGVCLAVLFFGSCNILVKTKTVARTNVNPLVFQLYMSFAIFVSSWFVLLWTPFRFGYHGMLGSALWVPGQIQAVMAVRLIGLGIGQAMWSGIIVLVSFLWGIIAFGEKPQSWPLTLLGLVLLIAGFFGISMSGLNMEGLLKRLKRKKTTFHGDEETGVNKTSTAPGAATEKKSGQSGDPSISPPDTVAGTAAVVTPADSPSSSSFDATTQSQSDIVQMASSSSTEKLLPTMMNQPLYKSTETSDVCVVMPPEDVDGDNNGELGQITDGAIISPNAAPSGDGDTVENIHYQSDQMQEIVKDARDTGRTSFATWFLQRLSQIRGTLLGLMFVAGVGLCAGTTMVPARLSPDQTVAYVVSFGTGALIVTILLFLIYVVVMREIPEFHFRATFLPGFATGVIWNIGNLGSTYASMSPLGLSVGYPLTQCALVIAGIWGLVVFKELKGIRPILMFFLSVGVLLSGCALMGVFGTTPPTE